MPIGYVYIMSNQYHGTMYVGVTSDLVKRVWQHKEKLIDGFTKRYGLTRLIWFECHDSIVSAIEAEKKLKNLLRKKKIAIIEQPILIGMICINSYLTMDPALLLRSPQDDRT